MRDKHIICFSVTNHHFGTFSIFAGQLVAHFAGQFAQGDRFLCHNSGHNLSHNSWGLGAVRVDRSLGWVLGVCRVVSGVASVALWGGVWDGFMLFVGCQCPPRMPFPWWCSPRRRCHVLVGVGHASLPLVTQRQETSSCIGSRRVTPFSSVQTCHPFLIGLAVLLHACNLQLFFNIENFVAQFATQHLLLGVPA